MGIWQEGEIGEPAGRAQPWDGGQEYPSLTLRGTSEAVRSVCKLRTSGLPRQPLSGVGFAQTPCVTLIQMLQGQCFEKLCPGQVIRVEQALISEKVGYRASSQGWSLSTRT